MNSQVKRYFIGFFSGQFLLLGLWLLLFYLQLGMPTASSNWAHQLFVEKSKAANRVLGEKILVVAGSSTHFGLDAAALSKALARPVINFGTFAGLEPEYFLYKAKQVLKPGDTVILALEYAFHINRPERYGPVYVDHLLARDPAFFWQLPLADQFKIITAVPLKRLLAPVFAYFRKEYPEPLCKTVSFDPYGNTANANRVCLTAEQRVMRETATPDRGLCLSSDDAQIWSVLEDFSRWSAAHHIKLIAVPPNHMYFAALDNEDTRKRLSRLKKHYTAIGIPYFGDPFKAMLDKSLYFDTIYHPNELGRALYTSQLASSLRQAGMGASSSVQKVEQSGRDNPLALALSKFSGFEAVQGLNSTLWSKPKDFYKIEKDLRQFKVWASLKAKQTEAVPIVAWGAEEVLLKLQVMKTQELLLSMEFSPMYAGQDIVISLDEKVIWQQRLDSPSRVYHFEQVEKLSPSQYSLIIRSRLADNSAKPGPYLLFKSLRASSRHI